MNKKEKTNMKTRIATVIAVSLVLAATARANNLLVYNTHDSGAGSLRQAIADNRNLGGGNTIIISNVVTGTITLTGELLIDTNLTISGPGANVLAIKGNAASRVFDIINAGSVAISGLTITNGNAGYGGGIYNNQSTLTLNNCTIAGNSAVDGGGGLWNAGVTSGASASVTACTFSGNWAINGGGGGIQNYTSFGGAQLTVIASTFSGNSAGYYGGGGIFNRGQLTLVASTFSGNSASDPTYGGGIYNSGGTVTIGDTILKAGSSGANIYNNAGTITSLGYNLSGDNGGGFLTALGDQINTDPLLGPLQDNGGPTPTHLPLPGSPAIDQGTNLLASTAADQRGRGRTYDDPSIPNATGGDGTDIGAVEVSPAHTSVVGTTSDNGVSLRWCLCDAQPGETITFGVAGTVTLASGGLPVRQSVNIVGPTTGGVTVSGNNHSPVFDIEAGPVTIANLTIANGNNSGSGGGIYNNHQTLTVSNCTITGNSASDGGGIYNDGSTWTSANLTVIASTIAGNSASSSGGGLYNQATVIGSAHMTVTGCTIAGNSASASGGGVYNHRSGSFNSGSLKIGDTILKSGASGANIVNTGGAVTSQGYNLSNDSGGGFLTATGDQINTDPLLGPLADNGGPTMTMALMVGSPAIDAGKSFGLTTDQRGLPRIYDNPNIPNASGGDGSDIGAFEVQPPAPPKLVVRRSGNSVIVSWPNTGSYTLQQNANLALASGWTTSGYSISTSNGTNSITITPPVGNLFFRLAK